MPVNIVGHRGDPQYCKWAITMAFCISCIGHTPSNESMSIHNGLGKDMTKSSLII